MEKRIMLNLLEEKVKQCTKCEDLNPVRINYVFGDGNPNTKILLVGEGPGADENEQGKPFVGKSGKLLNNILEASNIKREDVYICNVVKCRPPENRNPTENEAHNCSKFLELQIKIINPAYIICLGSVAAQNLLKTKSSIGNLRGQFFRYNNSKVLATYHPSYGLRKGAEAKKQIWDDIQIVIEDMKEGQK